MRRLATVQKIVDIRPIEGADAIEVAQVKNWNVVVKKNEFHVGDLAIYCEVDSFLPIREEFEFLRKSSYKKLSDGREGFRLKTIKLRGQISQGLLLPTESLIGFPTDSLYDICEDCDVSDIMNVTKYEPPIPACLAGMAKGNFPGFLSKTDEERIQNIKTNVYNQWRKDHTFYVTEKLDGSSMTCYIKHGVFGVCSRNLDLKETEGNTFWQVARELDIELKLSDNFAIQGELIGPGIQGNPYKLSKPTFYMFNAYNIAEGKFLDRNDMINFCWNIGLKPVPVLDYRFTLPETVGELLKYAEGKSALNGETEREGIVIRTNDKSISFKAISNKFLLKNED